MPLVSELEEIIQDAVREGIAIGRQQERDEIVILLREAMSQVRAQHDAFSPLAWIKRATYFGMLKAFERSGEIIGLRGRKHGV